MGVIVKNQATAALRVAAPIPFYDLDGQLLTGQTFLTSNGEVETYTLGGGWVAAANDVAALGSGGNYLYQYSQDETNDDTIIGVRLIKSGYATQYYWNEIAPYALPSAATIAAAVLAAAHTPGRTVQGVLLRIDQLIAGKHTGLLGALWTLFAPDGTTPLVQATQDVSAGTREAATTIAGD